MNHWYTFIRQTLTIFFLSDTGQGAGLTACPTESWRYKQNKQNQAQY